MNFRRITFTLLSLLALSPMTGANAQTPAPVSQTPAPTVTAPQAPAQSPSLPPAQQHPVSLPPPAPGQGNFQVPPPVPVNVNTPGIEATVPAKIVVSGVAATINNQPLTYQLLVTKFLAAGAPTFLDEMINEQLIRQQAKKEGITVSAAEVNAKLIEAKKVLLPQYPGESWAQFLLLQGRSESYIRDNIYDGLLAVKLVERTMAPASLAGKVHLYHILKLTVSVPGGPPPVSDVQALREIQTIRDLIVSGKATFQDEARKESQDASASSGGDLGWVGPDAQLDANFSKAAFALKEGEISDPVRSQYGWHLILAAKLGSHATAADIASYKSSKQEDDRARAQIQPYLRQLRASAKIVNYVLMLPPANKPIVSRGSVTYMNIGTTAKEKPAAASPAKKK